MADFLSRTYGGKRAFVRMIWYLLRYRVGNLDDYKRIDWRQVSRVIFVCKGNICRSPFAEQCLRAAGIATLSAGLDAQPGRPVDTGAARVAARRGISLAHHRSLHVSSLELAAGDLLVAFEPDHAKRLRQFSAGRPGIQVTLIGLWSPRPWAIYLHDPYGLPEDYFEICFNRIEQGLEGIRLRCSNARLRKENMK